MQSKQPLTAATQLSGTVTGSGVDRRNQIAIVAEGGGQRGIFTAGVLDAFLQHKFNPFDIGIGVSAGAQNLLSYFLYEHGYARKAITDLTCAPGFFVPYRWLAARNVVDLDTYFNRTLSDPAYQLPYQKVADVQTGRKLVFVATDKKTLAPVYLEPTKHAVVDMLKASSAVPFLYNAPVTINDRALVDGGVADPLPIQRAIDLGARTVVVIRTVPHQHDQSGWRQQLESLPLKRALPQSLFNMLRIHDQAYARAMQQLQLSPPGVNIKCIAPQTALQSRTFGSQSKALVADYEAGTLAGEQAISVLDQWLGKHDQTNQRKIGQPELDNASA